MSLLSLFKSNYSHDKLENLHIHIGTDKDNLDDAINGLGTEPNKDGMVCITKEKAEAIRKKFTRLDNRWIEYLVDFEAHDKEMGPVKLIVGTFKSIIMILTMLGVVVMADKYLQMFS